MSALPFLDALTSALPDELLDDDDFESNLTPVFWAACTLFRNATFSESLQRQDGVE